MTQRRLIWIVLSAGATVFALIALFIPELPLHPRSRPRVSLVQSASLGPSTDKSGAARPAVSAKATPVQVTQPQSDVTLSGSDNREPAVVNPPPDSIASETRDLKDSAHRLNAIDSIVNEANDIFSTPGGPASVTVNQQNLDQVDYQSRDGSVAITKWLGTDSEGNGALRAEEAVGADGKVLFDRWYHPNGAVQQIQRNYDNGRSVSVYYYDNGDVEAMRVNQNGREVFTKYDHDGRVIQKEVH